MIEVKKNNNAYFYLSITSSYLELLFAAFSQHDPQYCGFACCFHEFFIDNIIQCIHNIHNEYYDYRHDYIAFIAIDRTRDGC